MRTRIFTSGNGETEQEWIETFEPWRPPSMTSDVWVPAAKALIVGGVSAYLIAYGLGFLHDWPRSLAFSVAFCSSFLMMFMTGIHASQESQSKSTVRPLRTSPKEKAHDSEEKAQERVIIAQPYNPERRLPEPHDPEWRAMTELEMFVRGCKISTAMLHWESKIGRDKYVRMRDTLIRLGAAEWVDPDAPTRGWRLTGEPDDIIEQIFAK